MDAKWLVLSVLTVALSGCSSDEGPKLSPAELCDGYMEGDVCMPHIEPTVVVTGLPETVSAYIDTPFAWALDNGTRGLPGQPVHSMDSRIVAFTDGTLPTNMTEPDAGVLVAQEEHKNLPDAFEATFSWEETGSVTLWGYMLIDAVNTWNLVANVTVIEPPATGVVHMIHIEQGPPPALGAGDDDITITVGDGVTFDNHNAAYSYTISFDCNSGTNPAAVSPGETVLFTEPRTCNWVAATELSGSGVTQGDLQGVIRITA